MKKEETNLYTITVPPMMKSLKALSSVLEKADKHAKGKQLSWHPKGMQESALLNARLIADQFNLIRQVQIACDNAKNGVARIAGIEAPKHADNEMTIKELKTRIGKTIAFLRTVKPAQMIGQEDRKISLSFEPKKKLTALGYATWQLIPNFYFHLTTAYDILRANGVQVGKSDYIGEIPFIK